MAGIPGRLTRFLAGEWTTPLTVPFADLPPVTQVRGTLLASSRDQLRQHGHFAHYERSLTPEARADLDAMIAMSWLPIELAVQHFAAVDSLHLTEVKIREYTAASVKKITGTSMVSFTQATRQVGMTPLVVLPKAAPAWNRLFVGGGVCLRQTGPKDMQIVAVKSPILASHYHRIGIAMQAKVMGELFSTRCFVREDVFFPDANVFAITLQWV